MKFAILILSFSFIALQTQACYLQTEAPEKFDLKAVHSIAFSLISAHVETLDEMPIGGLKPSPEDCFYKVSVNQDQEKIFLSVSGRKFSGTGVSQLIGIEGVHQALLVALQRIKPELKTQFCNEYENLLPEQCGKGLNRATGIASISYQCVEEPCPPQSVLKLRATDVAKLVALDELSKILGVNVQSLKAVKSGRISKNEIETQSGGVLKGVRFSEPVFQGDEVSIVVTAKIEKSE